MNKLTVGSCFSGIGGLELGLEWTGGFETKWQIENDGYASRVLAKHWPHVKRYSDIRDVIRPERVDLICGGFPCQDVSLAGSRKGLEGKKSTLWWQMYRLVCEVKPLWLVAENVPGLLSSDDGRFFGKILRDLAAAGYDAEWGVLSAAGVGAPHLRRRVFILAHSNREGFIYRPDNNGTKQKKTRRDITCECGETFQYDIKERWRIEPAVCRMAYGVSNRSHRLRCLGNAVVPQVAQKIGEMILKGEFQNAA